MNARIRFRRVLVAALFAAGATGRAAAQQEITFTGVIQPVPFGTACQQQTHYLTCSGPAPGSTNGVPLMSSTLDLAPFEGVNTRFTAVERGGACPVWDVAAAQTPPPATLVRCGSPWAGCPMRFRVGPSGVIGQYWLFFSAEPVFVPTTPITGTLLVRRPFYRTVRGLTFGPTSAVDITLPLDPSFIGLSLWAQGMRQDIGPIGELMLTNAVCFTIGPPSPPCGTPGC